MGKQRGLPLTKGRQHEANMGCEFDDVKGCSRCKPDDQLVLLTIGKAPISCAGGGFVEQLRLIVVDVPDRLAHRIRLKVAVTQRA